MGLRRLGLVFWSVAARHEEDREDLIAEADGIRCLQR